MKTKLYSIVAIILICVMAMASENQTNKTNSILIQSTEKKVSVDALMQSSKIISNRLRDFSSEKFEMNVNSAKRQIHVTLTGNWDLTVAEKLLTQKGEIGFYKSYDRKSLKELIKGDNRLFLILNNRKTSDLDANIGSCTMSDTAKVNVCLNSLGLNTTCKFVWGMPSESLKFDLYALCLEKERGSLLTGSDIESMKSELDKGSKKAYIGFSFKEVATKQWANITKENMGRPIVIVLDNTVLYAPVINSTIENGKCSVTGDFSETELKLLAALGNNGELPINFKVLK